MKTFLQRFGGKITGILSGFDRLRLRGTKRWLAYAGGMMSFLWRVQVLLKDFDQYVQGRTAELCGAMERAALRLEATINDVTDVKAYRTKEGDEHGAMAWRPLRKGVADLYRRTEVSQQATERYAESLATLEDHTPLAELAEPLCQPVTWQGQRVRALNPLAPQTGRIWRIVV